MPGWHYLTLNGFSGSHGGGRHSAEQYVRFGVEVSDAMITSLNHANCNGFSSAIVVSGGSNYAPTDTATVTGGGGTGGAVSLTIVGGIITGAMVISAGSGYSGIPTITIHMATGSGADLQASG